MKIELKSIEYSKGLSEAMHAFTARLYVDEVYVADVRNRGKDVICTIDHRDEKGRLILAQAELYCTEQRGQEVLEERKTHGFSYNLNYYIDDLLDKHLQEKENTRFGNKINKAMETGVVYGDPEDAVNVIKFKIPINELLLHPEGPKILQQKIRDIAMPELKPGEKVLNSNIPETILKGAGLIESQYVKPEATPENQQQQKNLKKPGKRL